MSMEYVSRKTISRQHTSWSSVAFIVESVLLLVFLVASLAVLTNLFSKSLTQSIENRTLDASTIAATSIAEHFAADPTDVQEETVLGDLRIVCTVTDEKRTGGTMYHAQIDVYDTNSTGAESETDEDPVYSLTTSRYVSKGV